MDTIKTMNDAIMRANEFVRPYLQKVAKTEYFRPEFSRFKLVIYYHNGKRSTYFSYDYTEKSNGETVRDEWNGMYKLVRLANDKMKANRTIKSAVIFATADKTPRTDESDYNLQVFVKSIFKQVINEIIAFNRSGSMFVKN